MSAACQCPLRPAVQRPHPHGFCASWFFSTVAITSANNIPDSGLPKSQNRRYVYILYYVHVYIYIYIYICGWSSDLVHVWVPGTFYNNSLNYLNRTKLILHHFSHRDSSPTPGAFYMLGPCGCGPAARSDPPVFYLRSPWCLLHPPCALRSFGASLDPPVCPPVLVVSLGSYSGIVAV